MSRYLSEGRHVNSTTSFTQPRRFITAQLYAYAYPRKEIRKYYRANLEFELRKWLAKTFSDKQNLMPTVEQFVNTAYWSAIWLIICGPILFYLIFCRCCKCCKRNQGT